MRTARPVPPARGAAGDGHRLDAPRGPVGDPAALRLLVRVSDSSPEVPPERAGPPVAYWLIPLSVALLRAVPGLATQMLPAPAGSVYPGVGYNPIDSFAYLGFIRQAAETGDWLLFNPHTTLPQDGRYFLPLLSLLGWVCRLTGISPFTALEFARVPLIFGFFAGLWRFTDGLLAGPRQRVSAALLVAFAGGLEFVVHATLGWWPTAWHRPLFEAISDDHGWSTFASLNNPLWIAGLTLGLIALRPVVNPGAFRGWRGAAQTGLGTLLAFGVHPYSGLGVMAVAAGVLGARCLRRPGGTRPGGEIRLATGLAVAAGLIGAGSWWQNQDPVFHATAQGFFGDRCITPLWYPVTLGMLGWLAFRGTVLRGRERTRGTRELLAWGVVAAWLHTSPWTNGYHFVFLLHLPLCLLGAPALEDVWERLRDMEIPAERRLAWALGVVLTFQSALAVTWRTTRQALEYAVPEAAMAAFQTLAREPAGRVYTSPHLGTLVPAYTPHRVAVGHWFLTPEHSTRQRSYTDLMAGRVVPEDFLAGLHRDGIGFVLLPPGAPAGVAGALAAASRRVEPLGNYGLFHLR